MTGETTPATAANSLDEQTIHEAQRGDAGAISLVVQADDWHALRRTGIGGSEVAAICGLNPWHRPIDVYREKIGEKGSFNGNERTRWGKLLEPLIATDYQRNHPELVVDGPFATTRHHARPWHLYTIDRLILSRARAAGELLTPALILRVLEIKSRGFMRLKEYGDEGTDVVPFADMCQSLWYVAGVGCNGGADLAVLIDTHLYREFHVARDAEVEAYLLEECHRFWFEHVVPRVPPPPDGSDSFSRYLRQRFDKTSGELRKPDAEVLELIERLRAIECLHRTVDDAKTLLRQQIADRIGEASGFDLTAEGQGRLLFKHDSRGRVNHSAVAEELAKRLDMGPRQLKALQDQHRYKPPRKFYSPRAWLKDTLAPADLPVVAGLLDTHTHEGTE